MLTRRIRAEGPARMPSGASTTGRGAECTSRSVTLPSEMRPSGPLLDEPMTSADALLRAASSSRPPGMDDARCTSNDAATPDGIRSRAVSSTVLAHCVSGAR